jgi:hypothetical protein
MQLSGRADFFQTQMLWTLDSSEVADLMAKPDMRSFTAQDKEKRREEFKKIVNDIATRMVQEFRDENRKNYGFLRTVNMIFIGIGVALLISSLIIGILYNRPDFAAMIGGVAIADFVAIFFSNPQTRLTGLLKDFAQFELIFARWTLLLKSAFELLLSSNWNDADVEKFQRALDSHTATALKDIEALIGKE